MIGVVDRIIPANQSVDRNMKPPILPRNGFAGKSRCENQNNIPSDALSARSRWLRRAIRRKSLSRQKSREMLTIIVGFVAVRLRSNSENLITPLKQTTNLAFSPSKLPPCEIRQQRSPTQLDGVRCLLARLREMSSLTPPLQSSKEIAADYFAPN